MPTNTTPRSHDSTTDTVAARQPPVSHLPLESFTSMIGHRVGAFHLTSCNRIRGSSDLI
jgi:hypothetical protein